MLLDETELLYGDVSYERRYIGYFDVLGWRSEIESAGSDPRRIARLAAFPRIFETVKAVAPPSTVGGQMTTFSDNVIVSILADPNYLLSWVRIFAGIQISLGMMGFWIRGAVTIGDLYHRDDAVFGPGLNRAHELETKAAKFSRIVLDPKIAELTSLRADYVVSDEGHQFLDPFQVGFLEEIMATPFSPAFIDHFNKTSGSAINPARMPFSGNDWFKIFCVRLSRELMAASEEAAREKHQWLLSRILPRIR
jgi:hypothetical protein